MAKWIALFSQTGSEIANLARAIGRKPDLIITNNLDSTQWSPYVTLVSEILTMKHDDIMKYLLKQDTDTLITLHGYLRIIPEEVCSALKIYNGHPAAIDIYPELKGKDPQERIWAGSYPTIGSVVHRVIPAIDEGEIVATHAIPSKVVDKDELYYNLKLCSLIAWEKFFKGVYETGN